MKTTRLDSLTKEMATSTMRRRALVGLGALGLGSTGIFGLHSRAAAGARHRCIERCVDHGPDNQNKRQRRKRCRRECENR